MEFLDVKAILSFYFSPGIIFALVHRLTGTYHAELSIHEISLLVIWPAKLSCGKVFMFQVGEVERRYLDFGVPLQCRVDATVRCCGFQTVLKGVGILSLLIAPSVHHMSRFVHFHPCIDLFTKKKKNHVKCRFTPDCLLNGHLSVWAFTLKIIIIINNEVPLKI